MPKEILIHHLHTEDMQYRQCVFLSRSFDDAVSGNKRL